VHQTTACAASLQTAATLSEASTALVTTALQEMDTTAPAVNSTNQSINLLKAKGPNGHLHRSKTHGIQ